MGVELAYERMSGAFEKWHMLGLPAGAALHHFTEPDRGDPHSHPWPFRSIVLFGGYVEEVFSLDGSVETIHREPGHSFVIPATHIHRIVELPEGECWTVILPGPWEQKSGFWRFEDGQAWHRFWDDAEFKPFHATGVAKGVAA